MAEGMKIGKFSVVGTLGTGAHSTILHIRRSEDSGNYALKVVPIDGPDDHKFLDQAIRRSSHQRGVNSSGPPRLRRAKISRP